MDSLPLDQILQGDCIEILETLPGNSVDLVFSDPPYFLQLQHELYRPDHSFVDAVNDSWDQFDNFSNYDQFTQRWLSAIKRVLKDTGSLWVIGTYHNIYRIGAIMQNLGFWFLNDIVWIKTNPMPNFRGVRFTNAHETLIWACKYKGAKYHFNYQSMKSLNEELQMRSDWYFPICTGPERIKKNGKRAHSTQKPEALLYRIIMATTQPGDVILDPFFGSGTTGSVAKKLHRHWIGIEKDENYVRIATDRISMVNVNSENLAMYQQNTEKRDKPRIPFGTLIEMELLKPGQALYYRKDRSRSAVIRVDGKLQTETVIGSIHHVARQFAGGVPTNGWEVWFYEDTSGVLNPIDQLRVKIKEIGLQ